MPAKILVVEDDADALEMLSIILTDEGFHVLRASDGQSGYDQAVREKPDLVLTDIRMPVLDGIQMIRRLRHHPDARDIRVVVLSAYEGGIISQAVEAGADYTVHKTVRLSTLVSLIREIMVAGLSTSLLVHAAALSCDAGYCL